MLSADRLIRGQQAGDEELAEFIKYHRQHWQEKEQAAKDWQAEHDRFMREEAAKAREEAALTLQRERESEAKLEAYRERKALEDKGNSWNAAKSLLIGMKYNNSHALKMTLSHNKF